MRERTIRDAAASDASKIADLHSHFERNEQLEEFALATIEPYVIAAIAALVNFTSTQNDKAEFLSALKSKYPQPSAENRYFNPGIINFYYQLTEAKLRSEGWPLDEMIDELHVSYKTIQRLLQDASSSTDAAAQRLTFSVRNAIFDRFRINLFIVLIRFNELYIARELAGEHLPVEHRIRWENVAKSLEIARRFGELSRLPPLSVGSESDVRWFKFPRWNVSDVPDHFRFDADIALALSAIILNEKNGRAPADACATAKFYASSAKTTTEEIIELRPERKPLLHARLDSYLKTVRNRIDSSCGA
jgi:AraC-like DNA-binding protein